jgi:hypothetical protein
LDAREDARHPKTLLLRGQGWVLIREQLGVSKYDGTVSVEVATPIYEGPFDLLLHLIIREEVDIHEISLSTIVDA